MTRHVGAFCPVLFGLALLTLAACNTTAGAGRDIEATGDFIEHKANEAK